MSRCPTVFLPATDFGAPLGTHGELRSLPWKVSSISKSAARVSVTLCSGTSVRTPLVYRRRLTLDRDSACMTWEETLGEPLVESAAGSVAATSHLRPDLCLTERC